MAMISIGCRFGWHAWTKWIVVREGRYIKRAISAMDQSQPQSNIKKDIEDGFGNLFKEQQRCCDSCGKLELRTAYA